MTNYEKYVEMMENIGNGDCKKYVDFNGVDIEAPVSDESGCAWFTKDEAYDYYGKDLLLSVWTEDELNDMPWNDK